MEKAISIGILSFISSKSYTRASVAGFTERVYRTSIGNKTVRLFPIATVDDLFYSERFRKNAVIQGMGKIAWNDA